MRAANIDRCIHENAYGKVIEEQYFEAFPGHFFKPDETLTAYLQQR